MSLVPATINDNDIKEMEEESQSFVPSMKVTYGLSKHSDEPGVSQGDFWSEKTGGLGKQVKVVSVATRYQLMAIDQNTKEFVASLVMAKGTKKFRDRDEYKAFIAAYSDKSKFKISSGFDQLVYLPDEKEFVVMWFSNKLAPAASPVADFTKEGLAATMTTKKVEWKAFSWYTIDVAKTATKVEVPNYQEIYEVYMSQASKEEV